MFRSTKLFVIVLVVLVFATSAFAFAATNTFATSTYAGEGSQTISGYTVSNIHYTLNAGSPSNIDYVTFDLDAAAGVVKASLVNGGALVDCTNTGGFSWKCTPATTVTVTAANQLRVIAVQ
jgi:hypothetical protein